MIFFCFTPDMLGFFVFVVFWEKNGKSLFYLKTLILFNRQGLTFSKNRKQTKEKRCKDRQCWPRKWQEHGECSNTYLSKTGHFKKFHLYSYISKCISGVTLKVEFWVWGLYLSNKSLMEHQNVYVIWLGFKKLHKESHNVIEA